jgi:hypothetical protein
MMGTEKHAGGRPMHPLKRKYIKRYNVAPGNWDNMTLRLCEQLEACKGEPARRLLMGLGIKAQSGEIWAVPQLNLGGSYYRAGDWIRANEA